MPRLKMFKYGYKKNGLLEQVKESNCSRIGFGVINHSGDEGYIETFKYTSSRLTKGVFYK